MKYFILSFMLLAKLSWACPNQIDPSKIMFFVDTNESSQEIEISEKAACERGETLVVIPKNHKEMNTLISEIKSQDNLFKKLNCPDNFTLECSKITKRVHEGLHHFEKLKDKKMFSLTKEVTSTLKAIQKNKSKVTSFIISGHDGGGYYGGYKGSFSRFDLSAIMKDFNDINEVKSVLLLGCYSGTAKEVIEWKNIFPDSRLIAGFDAIAPRSDRPQGHKYLFDLLTKEKNLIRNADQKKLNANLKNSLQGLELISASIMIRCSDGSSVKDYLYGTHRTRNLDAFSIKECESKKDEITKIAEEIAKFDSGEIEPIHETNEGPMRKIYEKARLLEHCPDVVGVHMDANAIFNLLFYDNIKYSFARYYQKDLSRAKQLIGKVEPPIWIPESSELSTNSRKDLLKNLHNMHQALANSKTTDTQQKALSWLITITTDHLKHFNNPFSWHVQEAEIEAPKRHFSLDKYLSARSGTYAPARK